MRGFEPIEEFSTGFSPQSPVRTARSLSPQKVHRKPVLPYLPQHNDYTPTSVHRTQFRPANISSGTLPTEAWGSSFNTGGYSGYHQAQTSSVDKPPQRMYQFQASSLHQEHPTTQANFVKDVIVVGSVPTNGSISTTPTKSDDVTPSTSDHSDVDDLVPRSIHSPSISDSQTPPSSTPGSPAASGTRLP